MHLTHLQPYFEVLVLVGVGLEQILNGFGLIRQICLCQFSAEALQHLCNVFDCHSKAFNSLE